jgi:phytoene synthase
MQRAFARTFAVHARTFSFAARFLPRERRDAATVLYAFCRAVDDLADEVPAAIAVPALGGWARWLRRLEAGERPAAPVVPLDLLVARPGAPAEAGRAGTMAAAAARQRARGDAAVAMLVADTAALAATVVALVETHGVPARALRELVEGAQADATRVATGSFAELEAFCYSLAGTVGLAMCRLLGGGAAADPYAARLGIAMQLTNVLRDIGEDLTRGRVYLPADEMRRFGVTRSALAQHRVDPPFVSLMRYQIDRARVYYATGLPGAYLLPPECRLAILVAGRLYAAILAQIERQRYDVFQQRAATSPLRKAWLAGQVLASRRNGTARLAGADESVVPGGMGALPGSVRVEAAA